MCTIFIRHAASFLRHFSDSDRANRNDYPASDCCTDHQTGDNRAGFRQTEVRRNFNGQRVDRSDVLRQRGQPDNERSPRPVVFLRTAFEIRLGKGPGRYGRVQQSGSGQSGSTDGRGTGGECGKAESGCLDFEHTEGRAFPADRDGSRQTGKRPPDDCRRYCLGIYPEYKRSGYGDARPATASRRSFRDREDRPVAGEVHHSGATGNGAVVGDRRRRFCFPVSQGGC